MGRARERGVVLVWALAVLAVLTAIGVAIGRLAIGTRESTWQLVARAQADALLRSAVTIGTAALEAHVASGAPDTLAAPWATPARRTLGAGWAEVEIEDLGRRIDLDATPLRPVLARLADRLGLPPTVVPSIADWTDPDDAPRPGGAERRWYATLEPPLVPANGPLASIQHLRLVRGVTAAAFARLAPYVTVDGQPSLNPNTAPPAVLDAWLDDPTRVARLRRERARGPVDCVGLPRCSLRSRRFLVHARARVGAVERRADVVVLVAPGLPGTIERWEPPPLPLSDGRGERRPRQRLPQQPEERHVVGMAGLARDDAAPDRTAQ